MDQGRKGKLRRKNRGWHELVSLTKHFSFLILFFPRSVLLYSCFSRSRGRTLFNFLWLNSSIDCHWTLRSIFRLNSPLNFMLWQLFFSLGCFHRALSIISGNFSWIAKDYFILVSIECEIDLFAQIYHFFNSFLVISVWRFIKVSYLFIWRSHHWIFDQ